ncbi:MAG: group II intron reverse transcriptase/maturase [Planctomycetaceae bacterium]
MTMQNQSAPVSGDGPRDRIKPAEDVRLRWSWTEASVWTPRMLTALEQRVKGGKWFSLMDKVFSEENLFWSWVQVAQNKGSAGVDHVSIDEFAKRLSPNLKRLTQTLRENTYQPQDVKRVWIPKPGSKEQRPLGIPTVRDRVVQTALRNVVEPIFEKDFAEHSYGFRPGRGCKDALRRVDQLMKSGYRYVVDADLQCYFDTIPHEKLMDRIKDKISDGRVLSLIEMFLRQGVLDACNRWTPETGSPQGAVISPLLSNIYLNPLDHLMVDQEYEMVRYADDFVILCRTAEAAEAALGLVKQWTTDNGLTLHPEKTRIVDVDAESFDFLGYTFFGEHRWPRKKSLKKLKDTLRHKTKRANGHSLQYLINDVNRSLRGWFAYFKHSHKWTFPRIDSWLRMRLRSILRKRAGRSGRGRGWDHHRWKNSFFADHGLFNLTTAHAFACQSSSR